MLQTLGIIFWPGVFLLMSKFNFHSDSKTNHKLQVNFTSSLNCYGSLVLGGIYALTNNPIYRTIAIQNSINYFTWDTFRIILLNSKNENIYIYHHILSLLMLEYTRNPIYTDYLFKSYVFGESSNILMYILYYLIKTKKTHLQKYIQFCHILWYGYWRIPWYFKELYYNKSSLPLIVYYPSIVLFLVGIKWWVNQCISLRNLVPIKGV